MSGQLVIAELDAFRAVLGRVQRHDGETVKMWCRSTITNAVHRVGPSASIKAAAEAAWTAADRLAHDLDAQDLDAQNSDAVETANAGCERARDEALGALDALIAIVRESKATGPTDDR